MPEPSRSSRTKSSRQPLILVLDDDESIGAFVRMALPETSFRTFWCPDVSSATLAVDEERPALALVDIGLRGHDSGLEFVRHLRSHPDGHGVPVVMMTGSADTLDRERALKMGADRFLVKPVKADTLRRVVSEMLSMRDDLWWALNLRSDQVGRVQELFFDSATEVPTLAIVVDDLRRQIESGETLQVYCLEIEPLFGGVERAHLDAFDELRREFVRGLHVMVAPILGNDVVLATSHSGANDFYCFAKDTGRNLVQTASELERSARGALRAISADGMNPDDVTVFAGGAPMQRQEVFTPRVLYSSVREAKDSAERRETRFYHGMRERLVRAIHDRAIATVFQPVMDLRTRQIIGYEALSRGPAGTDIESPEVIFELAREFDLVWDLEVLCIENVGAALREICSRGFLFFNLESQFISQLQQRGTDVFESFFDCQQNVVIEVTERSAIRDYRTFRRTLLELKKMGFQIAIDDCGSGYATLEAIAELQPDYLKVGHSLFHGVEKDPIRRRIVDLVARCADMIEAKTIAEAIETEEQLAVTLELGIQNGQGYYFAPPRPWEQIRLWTPS